MAALIVATLLSITVVLPAEYGIDPTGIGNILGLTTMGKIKQSLAKEAEQQDESLAQGTQAPTLVPQDLDASKPAVAIPSVPAPPLPSQVVDPSTPATASLNHTMEITLAPDEGVEVKLEMRKDAKVLFEWVAHGGLVNFDTHGDPYDAPPQFYHGYKKGRQVEKDQGTLVAAFDGKHGWFWRNRGKKAVTITLRTEGAYTNIIRTS